METAGGAEEEKAELSVDEGEAEEAGEDEEAEEEEEATADDSEEDVDEGAEAGAGTLTVASRGRNPSGGGFQLVAFVAELA